MTFVIAIDGPSGSGKSSTSRGVASALGHRYLDTGAMYRAMAWAIATRGVDVLDPEAIAKECGDIEIASGTDPQNPTIMADGVDVSEPIRTPEVTAIVSPVATVPQVRRQLVDLQRAAITASAEGIVVEGRDIGTVVAPDADLKIWLVADPVARAERRATELGVEDADAMREALEMRDAIDANRETSPMARADDAVEVDGTDLTLDEVIAHIVTLARSRV